MRLKKLVLSGLVALVIGSSSGCATISYYSGLVGNHLDILSHGRNIEEVLNDTGIDEETKRKLRLVQDVREYSIKKLHLPDTKAYTSYVDLRNLEERKESKEGNERKEGNEVNETKEEEIQELPEKDHIVMTVTACQSLQFEAKEWCYPIIGCQQAKGFYDDEEAKVYAEELKKEGWDVALNPFPAYSTGKWLNNSLLDKHFGDPVTNVMLQRSEAQIIKNTIHELTHQVVMIDDTEFNESFAQFVGEEGTRQYLKDHQHKFSFPDADDELKKRKDGELFYQIIASFTGWLGIIYDSPLSDEKKLQMKGKIFRQMRETYLEEAKQYGVMRYSGYFNRELNNAHLIHQGHYHNHVGAFEALYQHAAHRSWKEFYKIVKHIAAWPEARRNRYLERIPRE